MINSEKLLSRYFELSNGEKSKVLLMQIGNFYHEVGEDTEIFRESMAIKEVAFAGKIVRTCGFSVSALNKYIGYLVRRGKSVVIVVASIPPKNFNNIFQALETSKTPHFLAGQISFSQYIPKKRYRYCSPQSFFQINHE